MANQTHSMTVLKRLMGEVTDRGGKVIDTRTRVGKALIAWRAQLVEDLGGVEQLSTQQQALIDIAMRTKLLLDTIDHWLLRQPSLIDKRKRQLYPAVQQRTALADRRPGAVSRHPRSLARGQADAAFDRLLEEGRAMIHSA